MQVLASSYLSLPSRPGVYLFLSKSNKVLYVGKAKNLNKRVSSYFAKNDLLPKTRLLLENTAKIKTEVVGSEIEALLLEANYIKKYKPKYNARLTDGKAYPLIRITIKDQYPKVLIARRAEDKKSLYFGPFPNSGAVRLVIKTIRRIFPFQSVVNHPKRLCLYNHLGLCPCPGVSLDKDTPYTRSILIKNGYRKNISHIINFLKGNTKKVLKDLENERNSLSKSENFEKASHIQKKIEAIKYVTSPIFKKFDYRVNPNLEADLRNKELSLLKDCLNRHNAQINKLDRIECFDISNIAGTNATGSMVVFVNGEKDPSQYRRFRIRNLPNLPNDFAMMQQVISRRLNHKEWSMPDLIIVDGGKGQVSAAMSVIKEHNKEFNNLTMRQFNNKIIDIPVIGLAKREETIIIPSISRHSGEDSGLSRGRLQNLLTTERNARDSGHGQNDDKKRFTEVSLPKNSPALHLLMRIRDEAHRFAIFYHRKLRSKALV